MLTDFLRNYGACRFCDAPTNSLGMYVFLHPCQCVSYLSFLEWAWMFILFVVLICISQMTNDAGQVSTCFWPFEYFYGNVFQVFQLLLKLGDIMIYEFSA